MNKYNIKELEEKLERCRNVNLEDVTFDDVDEISSIKIDRRKPSNERILDFIMKVKNPYIFKVNGKLVRIRFSETNKTAEDCLTNVLKIIEFCNNKIIIKINTVIMNDNIKEIENIYNLINQYNIARWKIFRFLPVRDASKYSDTFSINDNISEDIQSKINELNNNSNIKISYNKERNYKTKYFIYSDGTIENNRLEQLGNLLCEYRLK